MTPESPEQRAERRRAAVPTVRYPAELPISAQRDELLAALDRHQVVIVAGETGSGKSTQLPKVCLELGRGVTGLIGHTQPRRLAARTIAERLADELGTEVGGAVGYAVRFTDRVGDRTLVKLMTDGILLAEIQRDRMLRQYDTIIVDEAHERSLNIDFILGYLKRLLPHRPDLKVVVTSATIDTERFAAHFDDAPVVEVSGRAYPVEVRYRPFGEDPEDDRDQTEAIRDAVDELAAEGPGDVLVFLSGEREIRDAAEALERAGLPDTEVLPLFARLSAAEQHRVFQAHRGRRVVLATNIAETSLTVPGVRYVVDTGMARVSRYSRRTRVQRLPIEPISRASADQRAGRCGRIGPGVCIRLYGEDDLAARPEFTEPEMLRTNLASVVLQMAALGIGEVASFPFVDPPDARAVADGIALLEELGALEPGARKGPARLTDVGRRLARLPVDPRLGRMILEAEANGCVREVTVIAAALSIQDPRERPAGEEATADALHARFADRDSDFLSYLALWEYLRAEQRARSSSQFRKLCRSEHLHYLRVREWQDLVGQLRRVARTIGLREKNEPAPRDRVHLSLLAGLLSHVGMRERDGRAYRGAREARFEIAPGSALFGRTPRWVMAAELVETTRLWGRVVARIQPEWAERVGSHVVKRSHGEPWWDRERGSATTHERVTLYGLPVVEARRVPYDRVDPAGAREMFLLHALVEGDWDAEHRFLVENRQAVEHVRDLEDRARRRDILVGEHARFAFFDARVPDHVTSARRFERWWRTVRPDRPDLLTYRQEALVDPRAETVDLDAFPDTWRQGDLELALSYRFDPGAPDDGVSVHVPLPLLGDLRPSAFEWHVPGHRAELVAALIRTLPKDRRRVLVPAPDAARELLARAGPADGPLLEVAARELGRLRGVPLAPGDFDPTALPEHLRLNFAVEDGAGRVIAAGRDLLALQQRLRGHVRRAVAGSAPAVERTGLRTWDLDELPRRVQTTVAGHRVDAYPALVDEGESVAVRLLADPAEQAGAMWVGARRLLLLNVASPRRQLERNLPARVTLALTGLGVRADGDPLDDCVRAAADELLTERGGPPWDREAFEGLLRAARHDLVARAERIASAAGDVVARWRSLQERAAQLTAPALQAAAADVRGQLDRLVPPHFVAGVHPARLPDVTRYLHAVERRLDRLGENPARDQELMATVQRLEREYDDLRRTTDAAAREPAAVEEVRWMLEELRVSLFAQSLGTRYPVSPKRVRRELDRLAAGG